MIFQYIVPEQLIHIRGIARKDKDFELCDQIRDHLDSIDIVIMDTPDYQNTYYGMNREQVVEMLKKERNANKLFDSWLETQRHKMKKTKL